MADILTTQYWFYWSKYLVNEHDQAENIVLPPATTYPPQTLKTKHNFWNENFIQG